MKKVLLFLTVVALGVLVYAKQDTLLRYLRGGHLVIALNTAATDLSPYGLDLNNRTRTANIYQGLVAVDSNLNIVPALAVSWGNLDNLTWEFRLREGVHFHDGSILSTQDVLNDFTTAKNSNNPQIRPYIKTIDSIDLAENGRIIIKTTTPDPLLLSKLSKVYIYKPNNVGTGPYAIKKWAPDTHLDLEAFPDYWGAKPYYQTVTYLVEPNWVEREASFLKAQTDLLGAVPPELAATLPPEQVQTGYGLEVNFLMFKLDDPIFKQRNMREAIQKLIDPEKVIEIGNYFVKPATQFVAQGVFGYNQTLKGYEYKSESEPRDLFGIRLEPLKIDYLASYRTLVEYLSEQFHKAGFTVQAIANEPDEILNKIQQNNSPLYLIGWQAEDGDAGSFFDAFVHSNGVFNQGRYHNPELDHLIEAARQEMKPQNRLNLLREIGAKLQNDLIGIPLFEPQRIYAVQPGIQWEPRLDGLILAGEVK